MTVIHTYTQVKQPKQQATLFSTFLATDKGYTSTIKRIQGGYRVIASDDRAVDFLK